MAKVVLTSTQVFSKSPLIRAPRVVAFNRLEARPRTLDFTRSLRSEVRDPLWMLTRQWQFGEFNGEDAASAVTARIAYQHETISGVTFKEVHEFPFDPATIPLETRVERESIPLTVRERSNGEIFSDTLFAVQWGKKLLRMLKEGGLEGHYLLYLDNFPIRVLPADPSPTAPPSSPPRVVQDADAEEIKIAAGGHIADGVAICRAVEDELHDPWLDAQPGGDKAALKSVVAAFAALCSEKFKRVFTQPQDPRDSAWLKNHLEYRFSVSAEPDQYGEQSVLLADQYHQGHLDWYSFDASKRQKAVPEPPPPPLSEEMESFIPTNVSFKGQPQPRFWEMEERQTDFGKIETSTTGLLHLLLAEFGLIYSNDWFMLPHPMPINTVCEIRGILVDDTFGRHTFIRPAGRGPETAWQRWAMFHLTEKEGGAEGVTARNRFYLVPAVGKVLESEPLERVNFLRDEMANMVWAVESIVPSQTGKGVVRRSAGQVTETNAPLTNQDENVNIRYVLGTTVPQNWTPFIAVHAEGSQSEIRLQRARMVGGEPPRGWLLREPRSPYYVEEEEVPRAGVYVERSWQRARWIDGRTFTWVGRRKTAGRGEGWSQLVFDQIVDLQTKKIEP